MSPVTDRRSFPDCDFGHVRLRSCRHGVMAWLAADPVIGRALEVYGEFAESENALMVRLVRPGDTVVDVGGNIGTVTLALSERVGASGQVHVFEPQRLVFQLLCANLALNGITNVRAHPVAVGSDAGHVLVPSLDPGAAVNFGAVSVSGSGQGEPVPLVTLDSLALSHCRLIKIDVEGMDFEVLRGSSATIERCRPFIYMEAKKGQATAAAIAFLRERRFDCYWHFAAFFTSNNFRNRDDDIFKGRGDINLIALPAERGLTARLPAIAGPDADWHHDYREFMRRRETP